MSEKYEFVGAPRLSEKKRCAKCACKPPLSDKCVWSSALSCKDGYLIKAKSIAKTKGEK